jgi:hypothetical protein
VSIIVQFRVVDPKLAIHAVEKYEDRLYSDVQLAARRSLASMTLEDILTNRNQLSEDILRDVKSTAATYGVTIQRADVKDLVFPGNLQEIMNKVLAAERMSQVQLVEARTKADVQKIESQAAPPRNGSKPREYPKCSVWKPMRKFADCRSANGLRAPILNIPPCCGWSNWRLCASWAETGMREFT